MVTESLWITFSFLGPYSLTHSKEIAPEALATFSGKTVLHVYRNFCLFWGFLFVFYTHHR
jgi:hypothetical protein